MSNLKIEIELDANVGTEEARQIETFLIRKLDRSDYHSLWRTSEITGTDVTRGQK